MFLYEKDLKNTFWQYYKNRNAIKRYQFECPARIGGVDLLTIEEYQGNCQICSFEFKQSDIPKAFLQAESNLLFSHKSFIVVPIEKKQLINDRYRQYLKEKRSIGVIGVESAGRWEIIHQPYQQKEIQLNQHVLNLAMKGI